MLLLVVMLLPKAMPLLVVMLLPKAMPPFKKFYVYIG
jgi:hypothetical protein